MLSLDTNSLFDESLNHARRVSGMQNAYVGLRNSAGKHFALGIASLVSIPVGFWLMKQTKTFVKIAKKSDVEFEGTDEYVKCKTLISELDKFVPILQSVSQYKLKKVPLLVRFCLNQMQKTSKAILQLHTCLLQKVDRYNKPVFSSKRFSFVSENELWSNRNNAYKYWL